MTVARLNHFCRPVARLDFTNMDLFEEDEAEARLADAATDRQREFIMEKRFMEREFGAFLVSGNLELSPE